MENITIFTILLIVIFGLILLRRYTAGVSCSIKKDLTGQIAIITGGNTGIGFQTAYKLAQMGCGVIIGARDQQKNKKAVAQIARISKAKVIAYKLDLSDKQSIQKFVRQIKKQLNEDGINFLVNNAGVILIPNKKTTKQGLEMHIGVNHFGHFYLTFLLWPLLKKAINPRIINVSARPFQKQVKQFHLNLDDINFNQDLYTPLGAYARSKKANVYFTRQLQHRMDESKFHGMSFSVHPGYVNTEASRQLVNSSFRKFFFKIAQPLIYLFMKTANEGAQTILYTLLERQQKLIKGQLYTECKVYHFTTQMYTNKEISKRLWDISENIFEVKFEI